MNDYEQQILERFKLIYYKAVNCNTAMNDQLLPILYFSLNLHGSLSFSGEDVSLSICLLKPLPLGNEAVPVGHPGLHLAEHRVNLWALHLDFPLHNVSPPACHGSLNKWAATVRKKKKKSIPPFIKFIVSPLSKSLMSAVICCRLTQRLPTVSVRDKETHLHLLCICRDLPSALTSGCSTCSFCDV